LGIACFISDKFLQEANNKALYGFKLSKIIEGLNFHFRDGTDVKKSGPLNLIARV
jgi:hypothetical protein